MTLTPSTLSSPAAIRIFLVEDSPDVRDLLIENLQEIPGINYAGFSETESDALNRLHQDNYDVLILDIQLKQGNGMSLLQSLTRASMQPGALKIIFSNNVSNAYRQVGAKLGVEHFFDKSSEFLQLRQFLERLGAGGRSAAPNANVR
ncbi:MAG: response regulator [Herbaspirillum sp.]|jgi:DNA-binding NarL/FixJ family response regulator|nr:response regulator [Herbaspirillum sp.]